MSKSKPKIRSSHHHVCSVIDCTNPSISLHKIPGQEDVKAKWIDFIFDGNVPARVKPGLYVCRNHFTTDSYENLGMVSAGFSSKTFLKRGVIPTIRQLTSSSQQDNALSQCSITPVMVKVEDCDNKDKVFVQCQSGPPIGSRDFGCQTEKRLEKEKETRSYGTQLSLTTLRNQIRSKACQATVLCVSIGVGTTVHRPRQGSTFRTPLKPFKRQLLEPDDDRGGVTDPYIPGESVCTEEPVLQHMVDELCLLQLFEDCPSCGFMCDVKTTTRETYLHVHQKCLQCTFKRNWMSQVETVSLGDPRSCTSEQENNHSQCSSTDPVLRAEDRDHQAVTSDDPGGCASDPETSAPAITEIIRPSDDDSSHGPSEDDLNSDSDWDPLESHDMVADEEESDEEEEEEEPDEERQKARRGTPKGQLCPECGIVKNPRTHKCEHKKPFSCLVCGKRFTYEHQLRHHGRVHEDGYMHACKFCNDEFRTRADKLAHEESHPPAEKPYLCPHCPQAFARWRPRRDHVRSHTGPEHVCRVCRMEFTNKDKLRQHERVHTKEKPFACEVCGRSFTQQTHLKSHMRLHTGEKPYKCRHCDKSFNHNVSLKSHVQRYHGGRAAEPGTDERAEKTSTNVSEVENDGTNQMDGSAVDETNNETNKMDGDAVDQTSDETNQTDGKQTNNATSEMDSSAAVDAEGAETDGSGVDATEAAEQSSTLCNPDDNGGDEEKEETLGRRKKYKSKSTGRPIGRPKRNTARLCVSNEDEKDQGDSESTDEEHDSDPSFDDETKETMGKRKRARVDL